MPKENFVILISSKRNKKDWNNPPSRTRRTLQSSQHTQDKLVSVVTTTIAITIIATIMAKKLSTERHIINTIV